MYYLYVLKSEKFDRHYIGITNNIEKRLIKHNTNSVRSTKSYRPWLLVYKEVFTDKTSARKREVFLKKTAAAREDVFSKFK